ncbi:helix-turn-helix domain-containing protein [Tautonia sp. JC769]|uniref:helix-turn-helix transcriptional regulator n=1 Tax=Tautonia sp. JC769 TaxID=3232135 RepID=UPI003457F0F7
MSKPSIISEPPSAPVEPLLSIDDLGRLLNCGRRTIERMLSAGKLPKPDLRIGRMPRWQPTTIRHWIASGGIK